MDLKTYLDTHDGKALAKKVGKSPVYLRHIALGYRQAGETLALDIERETGELVTVAELRPDLAEKLAMTGYSKGAAPAPSSPGREPGFPEPVHDDPRAGERRQAERRVRGEQRRRDRRACDRRDEGHPPVVPAVPLDQ